MAFKLIQATHVKTGNTILIEGVACVVKSNDVSRPGKHGHAKCRIEAVSILDGKKKVVLTSGHDKLESPMISKNKAQVLSIMDDKASIMDLESYETLEIKVPEELKEEIKDGEKVEYWDVEGTKIIKRKI